MKNLLLCHGLLEKHHKYEFSIPEGSHHASEVFSPNSTGERPRFYLSLFLREVGFTLPLLDFIQGVLYHFNVAWGNSQVFLGDYSSDFSSCFCKRGIYPFDRMFWYMYFSQELNEDNVTPRFIGSYVAKRVWFTKLKGSLIWRALFANKNK